MNAPIRRISNAKGSNLTIKDLEDLAHSPELFRGFANKKLSYFNGQQPQNFTNTMTQADAAQALGAISNLAFLTQDNKTAGIGEYIASRKGKNKFTLQITNTNAVGGADITVSIFAGAFKGTALAANSILDAIANLTVVSKTPNKVLPHLTAHLNANPTLLKQIRIDSASPIQVIQSFIHKKLNPFSDDITRQIDPVDAKSSFQNLDTFADLQVNELIDDSSVLTYTIIGGATVTLTFTFGPSLNKSVAFAQFMKVLDDSAAFVGQDTIAAAAARANFAGNHQQLMLG